MPEAATPRLKPTSSRRPILTRNGAGQRSSRQWWPIKNNVVVDSIVCQSDSATQQVLDLVRGITAEVD